MCALCDVQLSAQNTPSGFIHTSSKKTFVGTAKARASFLARTLLLVRRIPRPLITLTPSLGRDTVRQDPKIVELSAKYKVTPNQIILGWHLARGVPMIPGSKNAERQKENLQVLS